MPEDRSVGGVSSAHVFHGGVCVVLLSTWALMHFAHREAAWVPFLTSLATIVLPAFAAYILVSIDVWEALCGDGGSALPTSTWEANYWITFILAWIVCPLMIEYEVAGDFTPIARLRTCLRQNSKRFAAYSVVLLVMLVIDSASGAGADVRVVCMVVVNAWGLLLGILCLGHGLVLVPLELWRLAKPSLQLRSLYCVAVSTDETRLSTQDDLHDIIREARQEVSSRSARLWNPELERAFGILQMTLEESEQLHCELTHGARDASRVRGDTPSNAGSASGVPRSVEEGLPEESARLATLVELHRGLKQAGCEARRAACRWNELVRQCLLLEDLEEHMYPSAVEFASSWEGSYARFFCHWPPARTCCHKAMLCWMKVLRTWVLRLAALIFGALSCVLVIGQSGMTTHVWPGTIVGELVGHCRGYMMTQVLCLVVLSYLIGVAYWSLFRFRFAGLCGFYPGRTDAAALLWNASTFGRLAPALCYHLVLLARVPGTSLESIMNGRADTVTYVGERLETLCPAAIGFIALAHIFGVYPRVVALLRLEALEVDRGPAPPAAEECGELLSEGRRLVERERRRRSEDRSLLEMHARGERNERATVPLRLQVAALIEDGTLPLDWNAHSPP